MMVGGIRWSLMILAGWGGSFSPLLAGSCDQTKMQECGAAGDFACAYAEARMCLAGSDFVLVDKNDVLLVRGAVLLDSFMQTSKEMKPEEVRTETDYLLSEIGRRYPHTVHFWSTLHTIRFEACDELGDETCSTESARFLCNNAETIAMPTMSEERKRQFIERIVAAMETECRVG
ncbi:MAG: hypothetical protein JNK19_16120 [Tabrizicola sp.]|nr:hypothetical protein [Tabrizicola sp.]